MDDKQWHMGMLYGRDANNDMEIMSDELVTVERLPAERGSLGARIWIEGYKAGFNTGVTEGRAAKAMEIRSVLGVEE